jgi:hypothetical protein
MPSFSSGRLPIYLSIVLHNNGDDTSFRDRTELAAHRALAFLNAGDSTPIVSAFFAQLPIDGKYHHKLMHASGFDVLLELRQLPNDDLREMLICATGCFAHFKPSPE